MMIVPKTNQESLEENIIKVPKKLSSLPGGKSVNWLNPTGLGALAPEKDLDQDLSEMISPQDIDDKIGSWVDGQH